MIKEIIAAIFLGIGIFIYITATIGVWKFKYVLNRMHAAAMGDTLGILFSVIAGIIYYGIDFISLKLIVIIIFFWITSPVASHLIAQLEYTINHQASFEEYDEEALSEEEEDK